MAVHFHRSEAERYSAHNGRNGKEQIARGMLLERAEKTFTAEEFAELLDDLAKNRVEVRVYNDGVCLTRTYS